MTMKIEIAGVKKSFGFLEIYKDLNMTIEPGSVVVVMGKSGAGKSVMLKHLTGLLQPDAGSIKIDDKDIADMDKDELMKTRMRFGMIFQNGGMLQSLTVAQNVALPMMEVKGVDYRDIMDKVSDCLKRVNLEGREDQMVSTLSGGQKKRVAIARALLQDADCFLFDEPTAGLDPPMSETVDEIIRQVNDETKATVIIVTHDLVTAFSLGQKMFLLHDGKIHLHGTPEEFLESKDPIVTKFLGRSRTIENAERKSRESRSTVDFNQPSTE